MEEFDTGDVPGKEGERLGSEGPSKEKPTALEAREMKQVKEEGAVEEF